MNAIGNNWDCEQKERKRAKNIVVGDSIIPRLSLKPRVIDVETLEITPKGKVVINRGATYLGGEIVFQAEQWVDICNPRAILPV
jgi:hypothetical protein